MSLSTVKISQLTPINTLNASDLFVVVNKTDTTSPETHSLSARAVYDFIKNQEVSSFLPISGGTITGNLSILDTLHSNNAIFSSLTATSAIINIIDIKQYELSGFNVTGDLSIYGNVSGFNLRTSFGMGSSFGDFSFAEGINTIASGRGSHAEGEYTTASGNDSHAEGKFSTASGIASHVEGSNTQASGFASHAEGNNTEASGVASHSEGGSTIAYGNASHAEGDGTIAYGTASHAEGSGTQAFGVAGHAEGGETTASGYASHAEGDYTTASGNASHAEGFDTTASGDYSHAEGQGSIASGLRSHAEGEDVIASGINSHAQNNKTKAIGDNSTAEGLFSESKGNTSHAGGYKATAAQNYSYAWSDGNTGTVTNNISSTRTGQYMVSASGGVFIPGNVGIGTDNNSNALSVNGNISSSQIVYSNELDFGSLERPSLTGIKQALNSFLYVNPSLSYLRINGSSSQTLEVGQSLTTPTITWNSNKVEPQAVSNYKLVLPNSSSVTNNYTFSSYNDPNTYNITNIAGTATQQTSSWSVTVTDWAGAQSTSNVSANWRYRVYYGKTNQANPNSAQILAGTENSVLATGRTGLGAKTVTPSNQYFFVAYPQRFGTTSQIKVNGLNNTDITQVAIVSFTNAYGGTADYYVYRSNNLLTATYTIEIV